MTAGRSKPPRPVNHHDAFRVRLRAFEEQLKHAPGEAQIDNELRELDLALAEIEVADEAIAAQNEELVAAREALENERFRYHNLFHFAPYGYLATDLAGAIVEANRSALDLLQISAFAALGKPLAVFLDAQDLPRFRDLLARLKASDRVDEWEAKLRPRRRRTPLHTVMSVSRLEATPHSPAVLLWALRDVSAIKAAEEALRESEERLRHAQRLEAVGRLAGGIAHSFNNLLAGMAFHVDLLAEGLAAGREPAQLDRFLDEIRRARERAAALASQLLTFSRRQLLQPRALILNDVLAGMEPMVKELIGERVTLELRLAPDTGAVHCDLAQLEQVLLNLLVNARDAMPRGGRCTVETAAVEVLAGDASPAAGLAPGRYARLAIADTGIGMAPDVLNRIFEPFFTTKERGRGTGLGLATVYGILQQGNGRIQVDSAPDVGSRFEIFLPQTTAIPAAVPADAEATTPPTGSELILLVEDEEGIRMAVAEVLESRGYRVLAAADAAEASRLAAEQQAPIDLLVTDVVIPGLSGVQLAKQLAQTRPSLRVLYMSGYPEDALDELGHLDPRAFLQKPFPPAQFLRAVRTVLDGGPDCGTVGPQAGGAPGTAP